MDPKRWRIAQLEEHGCRHHDRACDQNHKDGGTVTVFGKCEIKVACRASGGDLQIACEQWSASAGRATAKKA
jgi:hypothetical protein